jgi:hypothetical protein
MEGMLLVLVLIISVIVRTESSYGGKNNDVDCDNVDIVKTECLYEKETKCTPGFFREG